MVGESNRWNNYAISTADLAQSLTKSSGSLVAANGTLEEAVALTAAANTIIQDADVVGTALKTVAMRLRGTDTQVMEEEGLDTDGVVSSTSKLRGKVKALSGVDILTQTGDYKSTYQILSEIAEVWEDINDMDQAALLELIAGKRSGSVMSAILQNPDTLTDAFESATEAEGSALKENEKYLDSIQGRMDLFTNAVQTMWQNTLDDRVVKYFVDIGTSIVKFIDKVGLIPTALGAALTYFVAIKKNNPITMFKDWGASMVDLGARTRQQTMDLKNLTVQQQASKLASEGLTQQQVQENLIKNNNITADRAELLAEEAITNSKIKRNAVTAASLLQEVKHRDITLSNTAADWLEKQGTDAVTMAKLQEAYQTGILNKTEYADIATTYALTTAKQSLALGIKGVGVAIKTAISTNPVGFILTIISTIASLVMMFDYWAESAEDVAEASENALTTYKNAMSTLRDHRKTIQDVRHEYEELSDGVDMLGNNVSLTTEEYERYNEITNQIADMFPEMVTGYTEEGNAIIALKGNVEALTEAYEKEAKAARQALLAEQTDVFDNFKNNTIKDDGWFGRSKADEMEFLERIIAGESSSTIIGPYDTVDDLESLKTAHWKDNILEAAGVDTTTWLSSYDKIDGEIQKHLPQIQAYYNTLKAQYEAETNAIRDIANAYLEESFDYQKLSSSAKSTVKSFVNQFGTEFYSRFDSAVEMEAWIDENLVEPLKNADTAAEFEATFNLQTQFNNGEVTIQEYETKIAGIISLIDKLGLENADEIKKSVRLIFDVDDSGVVNSSAQEVAKGLLDPSDHGMIKQLTKAELDVINKYASEWANKGVWNVETGAWEITESTLYSWEELNTLIEDAMTVSDDTSSADTIQSFVNISEKLSSLGGAFDEFEEKGKVSIDTMSDLSEKFGNIDGFEDFINVLGNSSSTTEQVETAIANMASAYLETTGILSDVTDANREFVLSQLEALGVTNAEEYLNNLQLVHQAMADQYGVDLSNYATAAQMKQAISSDLYSSLMIVENMTIEELASKYGDDLYNYATLEEAKTEAARRESLKRAEILKGEKLTEAEQDAEGWKNAQTTGDKGIKTAEWDNDLKNKTYSQVKAELESGRYSKKDAAKVQAWLDSIDEAAKQREEEAKKAAEDAYNEGVSHINDSADQFLSVDEYVAKYNLKIKVDVPSLGEDDPIKDIENGWDKLIKKYERELALITNERDLIEAEVDKAEAQGGQASMEMYDDLIRSQIEEKALLAEKKQALEDYLEAHKDSIDPDTWTEYNNEINETAVAIKECTTNIIDFAKELREIDMHYFEQALDSVSRLGEEIEFIMSLFEDEDMFDEAGNLTEAGVTKINLLRDLMTVSAKMANMWKGRLNDLNSMTFNEDTGLYQFDEATKNRIAEDFKSMLDSGQISQEVYEEYITQLNEAFAAGGFSKELWTEWRNEAEDGLRDAISTGKDAEDQLIEMSETRIDAIENGIQKEIEAYEDYIDVLKEALDAERDLYDFKKDVTKQTKDIAALERRIAALSGSTNASDIAERRKLEAELVEAKEGLNDTYYDHAKEAQSNALDDEIDAFRKAGEKYVEYWEEYSKDTTQVINDMFLNGIFNADVANQFLTGISDKYGVPLSKELTTPWGAAAATAQELKETVGVPVDNTVTMITDSITSKLGTDDENNPWNKAIAMAGKYADFLTSTEFSIDNQDMNTLEGQLNGIVSGWDKVAESADNAYNAQNRATSVGGNHNAGDVGGNPNAGNGGGNPDVGNGGQGNGGGDGLKDVYGGAIDNDVERLQAILNQFFGETLKIDGDYGPLTTDAVKRMQAKIGDTQDGKYAAATKKKLEAYLNALPYVNSFFMANPGMKIPAEIKKRTYSGGGGGGGQFVEVMKYAKGTLGTKRDELAITDESWIGEEITLAAGKRGQLQYLKKGSAVMPADISANLIEWGQLNPNMLHLNGAPNINMINNAVNKPEVNLTFDALVKADRIDEGTLPEVKRLVQQEVNSLVKKMNYAIKTTGGR